MLRCDRPRHDSFFLIPQIKFDSPHKEFGQGRERESKEEYKYCRCRSPFGVVTVTLSATAQYSISSYLDSRMCQEIFFPAIYSCQLPTRPGRPVKQTYMACQGIPPPWAAPLARRNALHHIQVVLQLLTPSKASLYCYRCDEEKRLQASRGLPRPRPAGFVFLDLTEGVKGWGELGSDGARRGVTNLPVNLHAYVRAVLTLSGTSNMTTAAKSTGSIGNHIDPNNT